ncbi:MAG: TIGR00282 family metallophosphoesterase [Actinobacteria bacterium]|nr:TIGR00282 family metallophosphoesterase [Actinomycetota bacterium]MBL7060629.1 TIGR00282 family metallophosphoesterase [Actinomycetota bacterium]
MKILFLGDIFGKPGRICTSKELKNIVEKNLIDVVIANGENTAGGLGISPGICDSLFKMGIDVVTSGNHIYKKKEIYNYIDTEPRLLKPANYPPNTPGNGLYILSNRSTGGEKVAIINICGRVFIENFDCPFRCIDKLLDDIKNEVKIIIVDFHAEVTSEKVAMGWYLDGRVSAVIGTHTHVQTADERILPKGTAYITDVGMVGPRDSVIGVRKDLIMKRFVTLIPQKFIVAKDDNWINGVIIEIDESSGRAISIVRINLSISND